MLLHGSETIMALSLKPGKDIWSMHNFHLVMNNSLVAVHLLLIFPFPLFYGPIPKGLDIGKTKATRAYRIQGGTKWKYIRVECPALQGQ